MRTEEIFTSIGKETNLDVNSVVLKGSGNLYALSPQPNTNRSFVSNSILIGYNLYSDKDYHLLIDKNGVKIDKIMTPEEHELIFNVIKAMI